MNAKAEQKARTREAILTAAGRLLRERGIAGARVSEVMEGAGLTVGGFYGHFATKEALIESVLHRTGQVLRERLFAGLDAKPAESRWEVVLKRYLSSTHCMHPEEGCPFPAVMGEVATTAPEYREAVAAEVTKLTSAMEPLLPADVTSAPSRRSRALALAALMVGGLTVARAVRGTPLADEVLRACRSFARAALLPGAALTDTGAALTDTGAATS